MENTNPKCVYLYMIGNFSAVTIYVGLPFLVAYKTI